jgi:hypothetical protein
VADTTTLPRLGLDERQLLVELQSLGVRVDDEREDALPGRRGGAGPSDALFSTTARRPSSATTSSSGR